ncbi:MAG: hypothetical protein A3B68_02380 [Candidatus Melainabacteria bacterium RIFCSPHIGHO2_02_FULL_34_12]|nr:MAG: hypothetical protein A3B68_02380 [Candidatus Melainabacteria bacterium RIFCSPHIGHO2_02_FULL_34_12]
MNTPIRKYKKLEEENLNRERQLSSLFNIISNNLLLASETLGNEHNSLKAVEELESVSQKAKKLAGDLVSPDKNDDLNERISLLKHKMLSLVDDLSEELNKIKQEKEVDDKTIEDIIVAKRLLRESHRGLVTIQD